MNRFVLVFVLAALAVALGCAKPPPQDALEESSSRVNEVLARADDRDQLSLSLGVSPHACVSTTTITQICEWQLGNREPSWRELARAVGTRDRVNVLCELPRDGGPREPESCGAYPRRSNRTLYELPGQNNSSRERQERARRRAEFQREANAALAAARTAVELSRLLGAAPDRCAARDDGFTTCTWSASGQTYGHGTLVEIVSAPKSERMRLSCRLPSNGAPRQEGSCQVEVAR